MRKAKARGAPIDAARFSNWEKEFAGYRHAVTEGRLERWLEQFDVDQDLAARVLDCVDFITHDQITAAFSAILDGLPGWNRQKADRKGEWRFVAFSKHAGESGDSMFHKFRLANKIATRFFNRLCIHPSELASQNLGPNDTVVFVDDFSATGEQAVNAWNQSFQELLPGQPKCYLVLVVASDAAVRRISEETEMVAVPHFTLTPKDYIFSDCCKQFNDAEKARLLAFCERADKDEPKGHLECGFVVVFSHRCPNNTIPILHADHQKWHGLFRRSG